MDGFLLIDKPAGITSHDVVDRIRRVTGIRRIGHGGTLDPFATGLLVVGIGSATKGLAVFSGSEKTYVATAVLGATSDTQDLTGAIIPVADAPMPDRAALEATMAKFVGQIAQIPPMYSAKKIGGKKLYELARAGKTVERQPVTVTIKELRLLDYTPPRFTFETICSGGTYVRTLAHDIGAVLGSDAYLESLRRTAIGAHRVESSQPLTAVTPENWRMRLVPTSAP